MSTDKPPTRLSHHLPQPPDGASCDSTQRRRLLSMMTAIPGAVLWADKKAWAAAGAEAELPMPLRSFTKLAPLGNGGATLSVDKSRHLPLSEMAARLEHDLTQGATGRGGYLLSGDLSADLFRDDCIFVDPTNRVDRLGQYQKALTILFDADRSVVELLGPLTINEATLEIGGRFRSWGFLKLPWHPYVTAYESDIVYRIGQDDGLIYQQEQTWSKSSYQALRETFTPTLFTPPPASTLLPGPTEPSVVTRLFDKLNGRRPDEYSLEERAEISQLVDEIAALQAPWDATLFPGTWKLVFFEGGGVDRRIPFPELAFNDQYQIFGGPSESGNNAVTNIGQLWGPLLSIHVNGSYRPVVVDPTSSSTNSSPTQRLQADIVGGQLCWNDDVIAQQQEQSPWCPIELPMIQGVGVFESLYLGRRLRVLQNLNGTGARGVQIRMQ